jgi:hypothetical protein
MHFADGSKLVAELILGELSCGPDCLCWRLRRVPAVEESLAKLGVPKFRTINEATEDLFHRLQADRS